MARKTSKPKVTDAVFEDVPETKVQSSEDTATATVENEENVTNKTAKEAVSQVTSQVPTLPTEVLPLNYKKSFEALTAEEQKAITDLADSVDVKQITKVMNFGSKPLTDIFEQCGEYLKSESGSAADQAVIKQVIEISKKATESYEDFNLILKEANFFQKLFLKLKSGGKDKSQAEKIQNSAITSFKLLVEFKNSYDAWMKMLEDTIGDITTAGLSDLKKGELIEKYIIAGRLAQERISTEVESVHSKYQETGMMKYSYEYDELKKGKNAFELTMVNLEKSRVANGISIAQLSQIQQTNLDLQLSIKTEVNNSMALLGQQLRNAVLNAKNEEVLKGKKSITRFNDELIMDVSKSIDVTAEEARTIMYSGFYNIEAAKTALKTVIDTCANVEKIATEMLPKTKAEMEELNALMQELEPVVDSVKKKEALKSTTSSSQSSTAPTNAGEELSF